MNPLASFLAFIARRRAAQRHAAESRRREKILRQIADRRARHREWRSLYGELIRSTNEMLRAEAVMRGRV